VESDSAYTKKKLFFLESEARHFDSILDNIQEELRETDPEAYQKLLAARGAIHLLVVYLTGDGKHRPAAKFTIGNRWERITQLDSHLYDDQFTDPRIWQAAAEAQGGPN
jgi:hypothetical protein